MQHPYPIDDGQDRAKQEVAYWIQIASLGVALPFGLSRLIEGRFVIAGLIFMVCPLLAAGAYANRRGLSAFWLRNGFVFYMGLLNLALIATLGEYGFPWSSGVILATAFVLDARRSLVVNAVFLMAAVAIGFQTIETKLMYRLAASLFLVGVFATVFSFHVERQRRKLNEAVYLDALTGVFNVRMLRIQIERLLELNRRYPDAGVSLVLVDLDRFKSINDRHGHLTGDKILQKLCELFQQRMRKSDLLFRYGGEEFVLLLPMTAGIEASELAEDLRILIEKAEHEFGTRVTASFGVTGALDGDTFDSLLGRADRELYKAKSAGRNRVSYSPGPGENDTEKDLEPATC